MELKKTLPPQDERIDNAVIPIINEKSGRHDPELAEVVEYAVRLFNVRASRHEIQDSMPSVAAGDDREVSRRWLLDALRKVGMQAAWQSVALTALKPTFLPAILAMSDGFIVLCDYGDQQCRVILPELGPHPVSIDTAALEQTFTGQILLFRPLHHDDRRADDLIVTTGKHWFWSTLWNFRRYIAEAAALSVVINILALAMSIFTMTVYNRVLPNQTYVTLWTLAIGVSMALFFELASRLTRAWITDRAGKKIDLLLGARIFRHVLNGRMENRAQSNGAFGNIMQSFESVRDLVTSAALTAVADLPFVLLFLLVIWFVAGPLVWCVLLILLTVAGIALLMQIPLRRHAEASMKIGSNRHGLIMETLDNLETIKTLRAENHLAAKHDTASVRLSAVSMKARFLSTAGTTLIQLIQQFGTVALLVWGAYLVGDGDISMGGIIATMTLMGRAIQPVSTLAALALRFQQAKTSFQILEKFMAAEPEYSREKVYVQLPTGATPEIVCSGLTLRYKPDLPPVIDSLALTVKPGEKIAILGKTGSGKSSLLRLLVGLYQPSAGSVTLGGVDIRQISPVELRSHVALVSQDARMMFGTLRDNLLLGAPSVSDEEMMRAAEMTGVSEIAAGHPMGYGMPIGERGDNLSGGQKQAISLTRALLARPQILLLDEPTSGMDMGSEKSVLQAISSAIAGRTVIIVTHRPAILNYVDRVVVLDGGLKVADGEKQRVLELLNSGKVPSASALRKSQQAHSGAVEE